MNRSEAINLALTLFRQDLDRNDVVNTLMKSNIPESTAYRYTKKAYEQYEWEEDKEKSPIKCFELKALDTIYKAMKWAETNQDTELAVKYANLYITNKKEVKKMSDSFMQNHQSALDSFMEDKAIQDLEAAGIYPDPRDYPDNDAVMEALYEDVRNEFPDAPDTYIESLVEKRFEELPEPGDYDD